MPPKITAPRKTPKASQAPRKSMASRAGLSISPSSVNQKKYSTMSKDVRIGIAAATEYIVSEILDLAYTSMQNSKHKTLQTRDIMMAIESDPALKSLFRTSLISRAGVMPYIHDSLLSKKRPSSKATPQLDTNL